MLTSEISALVVSRGENSLGYVIDSIRNQTLAPTEIVVVDSSLSSPNVKIADRDPRVRVLRIDPTSGLLEARAIAIDYTHARFSLLLDSTRPLRKNCLEVLSRMKENHDMIVLAEASMGKGLLPRLAQIDKWLVMSPRNLREVVQGNASYAIPRFFRTDILKAAIDRLRSRLGPSLFNRVRHGDHQLIFQECLRDSRSVGAVQVPLLDHYEDIAIRAVLRKYYGYGKSHRLLRAVGLRDVRLDPMSFFRDLGPLPFLDRVGVSALYTARGLSFAAGYLIGPDENVRGGYSPSKILDK